MSGEGVDGGTVTPAGVRKAAGPERLEDVFQDEIIARFLKVTDFKKFARSKDGLGLDEHEIENITQDNQMTVEEQKMQMLHKWRMNTGSGATCDKIREVVKLFMERQPDAAALTERLEDVFQDNIIKAFVEITQFKKFARSKHGLMLDEADIEHIAHDYQFSVEEQKMQLLHKWAIHNGSKATAEKIHSVVRQYLDKEFGSRRRDVAVDTIDSLASSSIAADSTPISGGPVPPQSGDVTSQAEQPLHIHHHTHYHSADPETSGARPTQSILENVQAQNIISNCETVVINQEPARQEPPAMPDNFLEVTYEDMVKSTKHGTRSNLCGLEISAGEVSVKIMVVEMEGKKDRMSDKQANVIGTDLYEIDFKQLHDKHEGKTPNHVMVLGDSGDGKTTLAKRYAQYVAKHKHETESLKDIEMVFYIQVSMLKSDGRHKPFNLLLSQQIGPRMTEALQDTGKKWLRDNSHKALFIIDGLDQSSKVLGGKYPKIDMETKADSNTILANVLSGHLFPGAKILSTARWSTFWNLHADYRAKKTVGLRGLDKDRIKELITKLCEQSEKIIHYLWNKAPNLLLLARSPMFLIYILQVLQQDAENPPETLSGIMVLVLRYFSGSDHRSRVEDFMGKLSKLAYHGMRDNRFVFSAKYVSNLQLKFEEMRDLVETNAVLEPYQQSAERSDLEIQFSHQSLQEILAALHIVNLSPAKFEECLRGEINESKMNEVRKFTYGILLNPEVMNKASKWMQGVDKDVDSKRTMMEEALRVFFNGNTARDAHILSLLHESGSDVTKKIGQNIHTVDISEELTSLSESYSMATVLGRCGSFTNVSFENLEPNPATIDPLVNIAHSVKDFKVRWMVVGEQINTDECGQLAELITNSSIFMLQLKCSNQVAVELCPLLQNAKISGLSIDNNKKLEPETFAHVADVASRLQVDHIYMDDCDLTAEKLATFAAGLKEGLNVEGFSITLNRTLESDGFRYIAEIIQKLSVQKLWMDDCDLSAEDLRIFSENLQQNDLKNKTIESAGFRYIPEIIQRLNLNQIYMKDCDLSAEDLKIFSQNLQHKDVKVDLWSISHNKTIESAGFRYIPEIIQRLNLEDIHMKDCDLTAEDLKIFSQNLQHKDVKMEDLFLGPSKDLKPDDFQLVVDIMQNATIEWMVFGGCEINSDQLCAFARFLKGSVHQTTSFSFHEVKLHSTQMPAVGEIIQSGRFKSLGFQACDLTHDHLSALNECLQQNDIKIQGIGIIQDMRNPSDRLITDLCQLLSRVGAGLGLSNWKLSDQHQATLQSALDNLPFSWLRIEAQDEAGNKIILRQTDPSTSSRDSKSRRKEKKCTIS